MLNNQTNKKAESKKPCLWSESTDELKQAKDPWLQIVSYGVQNDVTAT